MPTTGPDTDGASDVTPRALPAHPNLAFERKRARKLLRALRESDPSVNLADAQFAIAREYGFSSWPKLVEYFNTLRRHEHSQSPGAWYPLDQFNKQVEVLLSQHARKLEATCSLLAAFVPRFYDKTPQFVAASKVTLEEARLVVARQNRVPTWEALLEWHAAEAPMHQEGWNMYDSPARKVLPAIRADNVEAVGRMLDAHPELLAPVDRFRLRYGGNIMFSVVLNDFGKRSAASRRLLEYVIARGGRLHETVNLMLLSIMGYGHSSRDERNANLMEYLIQLGADPAWIAPNGYSVLEHMLTRGRTHAEIALVLKYAKPRRAFWIAAALGDVAQLHNYVRPDGTLTEAARKHRPDFTALGPGWFPSSLHAPEMDIQAEAFYAALINERYESMDFLIDRGFPVDYSYFGHTPLSWGVNSRNVRLVEYFISRGAHADVDSSTPEQRDQWLAEADPTDGSARRIYELIGGKNFDAVLARYLQEREAPPQPEPHFQATIDRACEEAVRFGQMAVTDDNLFVAFLRDPRAFPASILGGYGVDLQLLRATYADRLLAADVPPPRELPLGSDARETVDSALARRQDRHYRKANSLDLLRALLQKRSSPIVVDLVQRGLLLDKVLEALDRS